MHSVLALNPPISLKLKLSFNFKLFWLFVVASVMFLLTLYIISVNSLTKEHYLIQDYQNKISKLSAYNESLEINFSQSNSLVNVETYLLSQNFEKANQVKYIQIPENQVAKK